MSSELDAATLRKKRLEQLIQLAQAYKRCTRKELAETLGRDPTKLVPGKGVPKLDVVVELAGALEWPVGDVVGFLWQPRSNSATTTSSGDFASLEKAAARAGRVGAHRRAIDLAKKAYASGVTPQQRVSACRREAKSWQQLGRYTDVVGALTRGLREAGTNADVRRASQSRLAGAYYALWSLVESRSIGRELVDWYQAHPARSARDRRTTAFAHFVSGHTLRRLISIETANAGGLAAAARENLQRACHLFRRLAADGGDEPWEGMANTCTGGIIEAEVELGRRAPADALEELTGGLERVRDTSAVAAGACLESYGWWCIFGCNIALRHLSSEQDRQQYMAVLTNKADEIADRLDNWPMRERVFSMQYARWERAVGCTGLDIPCVIDTDDVRVITGTMGRFPCFRETGWRILQSAQVVNGG